MLLQSGSKITQSKDEICNQPNFTVKICNIIGPVKIVKMDSSSPPFYIQEISNLPTIELASSKVTMDSDQFICLQQKPANEILVVDIEDNCSKLRYRIPASFAILNPAFKLVALKTGKTIQVFNIETQTTIKSQTMADEIIFLKWISPNTIGIITKSAIYHWTMENDSKPLKLCERTNNANLRISDYQTDTKQRQLLLVSNHVHN